MLAVRRKRQSHYTILAHECGATFARGLSSPQSRTTIGLTMSPQKNPEFNRGIGNASRFLETVEQTTSVRLELADIEYLGAVANIVADMKPFEDIKKLARGCPDPVRYALD